MTGQGAGKVSIAAKRVGDFLEGVKDFGCATNQVSNLLIGV